MPLPVMYDFIPGEIKRFHNWVLWRLEERDGKNTKVPYQRNGKRADTTNPDTWDTYEYIISTKTKSNGIGFVFSENTGIIGIDWDKVRDPETGKWDEEIFEEIKSLNSYAELSQSGTGAHVLIKGIIPGSRRRKGNTEMYSKERFFVVTGHHIDGTPKEIKENQEAINKLYEKRFGDLKPNKTNRKQQPEKKVRLSDSEIIDIASRAKNGDKFKRLYAGDTAGYTSDSDADQALCSLLSFYTQDAGQIDNIFRSSGLYRDKWERADYSDRTINTALQGVTETYNPEKKGKGKSEESSPKKITVHFDEVGNRILKENHIFSMRDNGQIYLYDEGVYRSEGTEAILGTEIRQTYYSIFIERWKDINSQFDLPKHIPKATARYVNEVLAYIRAYTHITRESIEEEQAKYINFKNGLFNLDKWELEQHTPDIKLIRQCPVYYKEAAKCPQISKFLHEIVEESDIYLLCEIAGYCLTTDCSHQKAFMFYGVGSNGKSVFLALLEALVGGENTSAESLQKLEFDKYRTAKLFGKLVNICGDIPDSKMHKSEVFKKLTSGLDLIDGENKYQDSFVFRNTAKLVFSANILPEGKKDKAYYRRWVLTRFPYNFEGGKEDKTLIAKLRDPEELSGFLNLALQGLKRLKENGKFTNEKSIEDTQREYEFNSNPIAAFMDECTAGSQEDIDAIILYSTYRLWAEVYNKRTISYNQWGKELKKLGYENYRGNEPGSNCNRKITYWCNIKVIPEAQDRLNFRKDNEACPNFLTSADSEKNTIGQAGQASTLPQTCLAKKPYCNSCIFRTVNLKGKLENSTNSKDEERRYPEACPNIQFFNSRVDRTGSQDMLGYVPVLAQKRLISEQQEDEDIVKKLDHLGSFRKDLKNLVRS